MSRLLDSKDAGQPLTLDRDVTVRARALDGQTWSALTEGKFLVGEAMPPVSLRITEVHYHPADPSTKRYFGQFMFGMGSNAFVSLPSAKKRYNELEETTNVGMARGVIMGQGTRLRFQDRDGTRSMRRFIVSSDSLYPLTISFDLKVKPNQPIDRLVLARNASERATHAPTHLLAPRASILFFPPPRVDQTPFPNNSGCWRRYSCQS
jgi:hypothetical protein